MSLINVPQEINEIIRCLEDAGHEAYMVGGCVRDCLLGREPMDWDITTSARPETTMELFGDRAIPTGLKYGTVSVKCGGMVVEVTTYRTDGDYTDNRRPASIGYASTLAEDLSRRDFTINAIAYSPSGEIIDPFNGRNDLRNRIIRCVGVPRERFDEDALRMFRALRIAAKLGFTIHPNTFSAIYEKAHLAAFLSAERIKDEISKFLRCDNSYMLSCVFESGLMNSFGTGEVSVDFEALSDLPVDGHSRLAAMCYTLEKEDAIRTRRFLEHLRFDNHSIKMATAVSQLLFEGLPSDMISWKRLLSSYGDRVCLTAALVAKVMENYDFGPVLREIIESGECWSTKSLAVNGNDLKAIGYSGKALGAELEKLLMHVIECPADNEKEKLLAIAKADLVN